MSKMRNVHDKHDNSIDRAQSPLVKFCVTATSCIMIACVSICILLFKTDTIMDIDTSLDNVKSGSYNRTSVETVMNQLNKEEPESAGESALTPPENPNIPGVVNPNVVDTLTPPAPGEAISGTVINSQETVNAKRSSKDSWTMECTVKKFGNISSIITSRINKLSSISQSSTVDSENSLLTFTIDGQVYYAVALVEGFFRPLGAYQVLLDDGSTFYCVAIDAKSLNDPPGSGALNQIDSNYGHGYYYPSSNTIQLSIVEFSDGSTTKTAVYHNSAKDYPNNPNLTDRYVKSVNYIKQLAEE